MTQPSNPDDEMDFGFEDLPGEADPFAMDESHDGGDADPFDFGAPPPASNQPNTPSPAAPATQAKPASIKKPSPKKPNPASAAQTPSKPAQVKNPPPAKTQNPAVGLSKDLPVQVVAVLGKKTITVGDLVSLKKGEVVELNRFPNEAVDLVANGKLMAKGELVEIDGKLGVRIIKIFE